MPLARDTAKQISLIKKRFVYLTYVDDSGSTGGQLEDPQSRFQVIGGPIIEQDLNMATEVPLVRLIEDSVPPEHWDSFQFHTSDLFHGNKPFDRFGLDCCRDFLKDTMKWIHEKEIPILYGAVDKTKLKGEIYRNTNPVDMAFRLYLDSLDQWFQSPSDEVFAEPTNSLPAFSQAMIVLDGSRKDIRTTIEKAFRQTCKKDKPGQGAPGVGVHVFDDIFFADSKNSIGMQIADICMYFVARHLMQKPDSEGFYNIISDQIFRPQVFP